MGTMIIFFVWMLFMQFSVLVEGLRILQSTTSTSMFSRRSALLSMSAEKKYVVVTGGVISGIGKGITASSVGVILKMLNLRPTAIKIDPYLNVDAGTMSPFEHGETFVLDDGAETDLDLGNYERFLDICLTHDSNLTTGKIYQAVIARERKGDYLGKTVQIIPHITNEIIERIISVAHSPVDGSDSEPDVCVIELGGTIGDIESMPFVEALRQLQLRVKPENLCLLHVSMVPVVGDSNEQKTKPTQHSVKELRSLGLSPDFIVCRSKNPVEKPSRDKISLFCNVPEHNVFSIHDVPNIYHVPTLMLTQNMHELLTTRLGLNEIVNYIPITRTVAITEEDSVPLSSTSSKKISTLSGPIFQEEWQRMTSRCDKAKEEATIALVGKYTNQQDSYMSVVSALRHSCIATGQRLKLVMVESSHLENEFKDSNPSLYNQAWQHVRQADGILVPGGFGIRGIEGKVEAIRYARENKIPFLGICLGMQAAVIEFTRSVLQRSNANSREFAPHLGEEDAAVIFMPEGQRDQMGGTMRLGSRATLIKDGSLAKHLYGDSFAHERHRHRYEVNPLLVQELEKHGLVFSGKDETNERMEIVELDKHFDHPYFIAVQFHPEFKSRPLRAAPVFLGLLEAVKSRRVTGVANA